MNRATILLDYIGLLLQYDHPGKALELLATQEVFFKEFVHLNIRMKCLKIGALAFVGDADQLYANLPQSFSDYSKAEKYFFRLNYGIHAWLMKMPREAIREIDNLLNSLQKGEKSSFDIVPVARFFRRYFQGASPVNGKNRMKSLEKLRMNVEQYALTTGPEYRTFLPFLWLVRELKLDLSSR